MEPGTTKADEEGTVPIIDTPGGSASWNLSTEQPPETVYVKAADSFTHALLYWTVRCEENPGEDHIISDDHIKFTTVPVDLDADSNDDSEVNEEDDPIEADPPGRFVALHQEGEYDMADVYPTLLDGWICESVTMTATLTATGGITVWEYYDGPAIIDTPGGSYTWCLNTEYVLPTFFVQGEDTGPAALSWIILAGDIELSSDEVALTVVNVNLDTDSNNDDDIEHATDDPIEEEEPGCCLAIYTGHPEELSEVKISPLGATPAEADIMYGELTFSSGIRVWQDRDRTVEIISGTNWDLFNAAQIPSSVYVEGESAGEYSMTWKVCYDPSGVVFSSDTVEFSLLEDSLIVTNMAPLHIYPSLILAGSYFFVSLEGAQFERGGEVDNYYYSPNNTYGTNAPWDPYYPLGDNPHGDDGDWGGAHFLAKLIDDTGKKVKVNITLEQNHIGYKFYHRDKTEDHRFQAVNAISDCINCQHIITCYHT